MAVEVLAATVYGVEISPGAFTWTSQNFAECAPDNGHPVSGDDRTALRRHHQFTKYTAMILISITNLLC